MNNNLEKNRGVYEVITLVAIILFLIFIFIKLLYF
jgi:hypothetical protein